MEIVKEVQQQKSQPKNVMWATPNDLPNNQQQSTHCRVNQEYSDPEINPIVLQNTTSRTSLKIIPVLNINRSFKGCHNREIRTVLPVSVPSVGTQTMCDVIVGEKTGHVSSVVDSTS